MPDKQLLLPISANKITYGKFTYQRVKIVLQILNSSSDNLWCTSVGRVFHGAIFDGATYLLRQLPYFSSSVLDTHLLGNSRGAIFGTSSSTSNIFFEQFLNARLLGNFRGAIFDGLLHQLPNFSLSYSRRASVGKLSWSDLRWTSSPTFKFFFE